MKRTLLRTTLALSGLALLGPACSPEAEHDAESTSADDGPTVELTESALTTYGTDSFGVARLNPTRSGGREWFLPSTATASDAEWKPGTTVTRVGTNVFHVSGAPRMMVISPSGKAWWQNVEMTSYIRQTGTVNFYADQVPHWTMFARGEKHSNNSVSMNGINYGVRAPVGTPTWPGYPFASSVNQSCLATCYHGLFYPGGKFLIEKEVTHTQGYTGPRGQLTVANFGSTMNKWIGLKYVLRNVKSTGEVRAEMYVDRNADGNWQKVTSASDKGDWRVGNSSMNGCTQAPFRYTSTQKVTWAGPWAAFRMDNMSIDFKWLSVREIDPLP